MEYYKKDFLVELTKNEAFFPATFIMIKISKCESMSGKKI